MSSTNMSSNMDEVTVTKTDTPISEPEPTLDSDVMNIFYQALLENDMAVVEDVVTNQSADVNSLLEPCVQPWHRGWGAIHIVTKRGIIESLKLIVKLGADVTLVNRNGDTALHIASKHGRAECIEFLLQCNPDMKNKQNLAGLTPLIKAVFKSEQTFHGQYRKTIQLLLEAGADPNISPVSGITPLHVAASKAGEYLIHLLLKHGANVNAICSQGTSPLLKSLLLREQKPSCVKLLLDAGADVKISTVSGRTAIHLAVAKNENECVQNMLESGADPNSKDKYFNTPLWIAVQENNINIVRLLAKYGADVNYKLPGRKYSLVSLAISEGLFDMVRLLVDLGAPMYTKSAMGATPLYLAIETSNMPIIKFLLQENCDMDSWSNARHSLIPQSPLQVAIELRNLAIIRLLVYAGCKMKRCWLYPLSSSQAEGQHIYSTHILDFLEEHLNQVPNLKTLCRDSLRQQLKGNIKTKVAELVRDMNIPGSLGQFVLLSDLL